MGATLQYLTGGRFILGIGAGWHEEEYRAYGYGYPSRGARVAQLAEAIQIIRAMWTESPATFHGEHYTHRKGLLRAAARPDPPDSGRHPEPEGAAGGGASGRWLELGRADGELRAGLRRSCCAPAPRSDATRPRSG